MTKLAWELSPTTLSDSRIGKLHALISEVTSTPLPILEERADDEAIYAIRFEWLQQKYALWVSSLTMPTPVADFIAFIQTRGEMATRQRRRKHPNTRYGVPAVTGDPGIYLPRLRAIILGLGFGLRTSRLPKGQSGEILGKEITIQTNLSPAEEFAVTVHEFGHALLHGHAGRPECTTTWEIEAEMVSFLVSEHIGLDPAEATEAYINHYEAGERHVSDNMGAVIEVVTLICDALDKADVLRGTVTTEQIRSS